MREIREASMKRAVFALFAAVTISILAGTLRPQIPSAHAAPTAAPDESAAAGPFDSTLLRIAQNYAKQFTRIDSVFRVAPTACGPGLFGATTSDYAFSRSKDDKSHGQKLFVLYASDAEAYRASTHANKEARAGQIIVKQSWTAIEIKDGETSSDGIPTIKDGKAYRPGEQRELFIMTRYAPDTAGTDDGWVYGVVSADGKKVVRAGRLENCMSCHTDAPHGRLFGLSGVAPTTRPAQK